MLKVGLTGGIASGKSTVGAMFVALGAHLVQADEIARQLMEPGQVVYKHVVEHFGKEALSPDGTINRAWLAEVAFGSATGNHPARVQELNQIVHPAVIKRQEEWMEEVGRRDHGAIAIVEAALIVESGAAKRFDRLIVVTCRPEQRIERWAKRQRIPEEAAGREVARRVATQIPDEEKIKLADYVIHNSGPLQETEKQVQEIFQKLAQEARTS